MSKPVRVPDERQAPTAVACLNCGQPLDGATVSASVIYLVFAVRRTYGEGWGGTVVKAASLSVLYLFAFAATLIVLIGLTALTL